MDNQCDLCIMQFFIINPLSEVNDVNRLLVFQTSSYSNEAILQQFQLLCLSLASLGAAQLADFNDLFRLASLGSNTNRYFAH